VSSYFTHLERIPSQSLSTPFPGLWAVQWRAGKILKSRSTAARTEAAIWLEQSIAEHKETITAQAIEEYIHRRASVLVEEGGWELGYLPIDADEYWHGVRAPVSYGEIRHLLENWPADADDRLGLPTTEDIDDLWALGEILCSGSPYDDIGGCEGASEAEMYAVLALMQLELAASAMSGCRNAAASSSPVAASTVKKLIQAANHIVSATEAICYAERNVSDEQSRILREQMREDVLKSARKAVARAGGEARHGASKQAREWVQSEWRTHREAYEHNKSEFARHYMALIRDKFVTRAGEPLKITDKTIREVWLADSPAA
jgi:uncharacterized membrane protein